ncbi:unnamed protein product [Durusdinium trenchii]|uniref:Uncharacterized protein n=1 Tax=Durusdinium trenchii TaxID=1381693 RepID=A0ABP0N842_9DINO
MAYVNSRTSSRRGCAKTFGPLPEPRSQLQLCPWERRDEESGARKAPPAKGTEPAALGRAPRWRFRLWRRLCGAPGDPKGKVEFLQQSEQAQAIPEECQDLSNVAPDASTLPPAFGWRNGEAFWGFARSPSSRPTSLTFTTRPASRRRVRMALVQLRPGAEELLDAGAQEGYWL